MVLLAGDNCRHENLYGPGQVFRTVMRHGLVAVAVVLRSRRVIEPPGTRSLMASTGLALLVSPRRPPAIARAVLLAAIATPADEEDLATLGAPADDKAKRIHGSDRHRQELDAGVEPWDEQLVGPGSGARPEGSRRLPRAFVLFGLRGRRPIAAAPRRPLIGDHRPNGICALLRGHRHEPDDIAGAAVFLASRAGAWMTGQSIVVDGGALA